MVLYGFETPAHQIWAPQSKNLKNLGETIRLSPDTSRGREPKNVTPKPHKKVSKNVHLKSPPKKTPK